MHKTFHLLPEPRGYFPPPWKQGVNWMYIRRSKHVQDVFWMSYLRWIYVLCLGGTWSILALTFTCEFLIAAYIAPGLSSRFG